MTITTKSTILVVVSSPGPAEALVLVAKNMIDLGWNVELVDTSNTPNGLRKIFDKFKVKYRKVSEFYSIDNYFDVPKHIGNKIIDLIAPDKILLGVYRDTTGEKITVEDILISCAQEKNIPVFTYVDMWDNWFPKKNVNIIPDLLFVQDGVAKEVIKNRSNIPDEKIKVVGNPLLEFFLGEKTVNKKFSKRYFGYENKRVIAYFGQCTPVRNDLSFPWTVNCLKSEDVIIFSRHPRDNRDFRQYLDNKNIVEAEKLGISSDDILDFCDVSITHTSTMGLKAALLNIKTINIVLDCDFTINSKCPLTLMGGSQQASNQNELENALESKFSASNEFKQFKSNMSKNSALNKLVSFLNYSDQKWV